MIMTQLTINSLSICGFYLREISLYYFTRLHFDLNWFSNSWVLRIYRFDLRALVKFSFTLNFFFSNNTKIELFLLFHCRLMMEVNERKKKALKRQRTCASCCFLISVVQRRLCRYCWEWKMSFGLARYELLIDFDFMRKFNKKKIIIWHLAVRSWVYPVRGHS